jgi:hypothetical protein
MCQKIKKQQPDTWKYKSQEKRRQSSRLIATADEILQIVYCKDKAEKKKSKNTKNKKSS